MVSEAMTAPAASLEARGAIYHVPASRYQRLQGRARTTDVKNLLPISPPSIAQHATNDHVYSPTGRTQADRPPKHGIACRANDCLDKRGNADKHTDPKEAIELDTQRRRYFRSSAPES
jgi:hypothetical protein